MAEAVSFHEFERRGWSAEGVTTGYHEGFSDIAFAIPETKPAG